MSDLIVVDKIGMLPAAHWSQVGPPKRIILHDTAGPTLVSAEQTLIQRGLGYHYMIDRDGTINQYYEDADPVNHAKYNNQQTIGVSLVGGAGLALNSHQIESTIALIIDLISAHRTISDFSSHKEVDSVSPAPQGKIDPEWDDFDKTMDYISSKTGLKRFIP